MTAHRLLFLMLALALPLPYFFVETGRAPALWIAAIGLLTGLAAVSEGGGMTLLIAKIVVPQALAVLLAIYVLTRLALAMVRRWCPLARQRAAVGVLVLGLLVLACLPVYRSPAASRGSWTNALGMFRRS